MAEKRTFRGIASATLDAKGRMALPSRYREAVLGISDGHLVVTISFRDPCLFLYPLPYWEPVQKALEALPNLRTTARRLQQTMIGHATDLELDGSGRLLLTAKLREWAGLDRKLCLVGQGEKIDIWDNDRWNSVLQNFRDNPGEDLDDLCAESPELQRLSI